MSVYLYYENNLRAVFWLFGFEKLRDYSTHDIQDDNYAMQLDILFLSLRMKNQRHPKRIPRDSLKYRFEYILKVRT